MLFISCYFCCYIFYYTTVFVEKKKIICSNIIVCFVWFNIFFKLVSGENVCCFFFHSKLHFHYQSNLFIN